ncbi:heavy-metal-associated domain-containing protein [Marinifilum sp. D737]|uniref:heavy-metal-associated domain-containing protein n=1 Tax=Marinifilum sp. D737 TaxID=2969628 RepID=UPI002272CE07|nr:heavy-metal-associated domain-containing protein [Marinifilum sp. D737]MCY1636492.1 heavy-metal-associated domain-containing protein [Marinifilum sp. D737]
MKKKLLLLLGIVAMITLSYSAQAENKKASFKVSGNCGMCEKTIEKAAKSVDGVSMADWDKKTKVIKVSFDTEKTSLDAIHKAIAKVGYDTEKVKAKDEVYNKLHSCCKYERK